MMGMHAANCPTQTALNGRTGRAIAEDDEDESEDSQHAPPPYERMDPELAETIQLALDERRIFGIKQPKTKGVLCEHEASESGAVLTCAGLAAFVVLVEWDCPNCGTHKAEREHALCVVHTGLYLAGESPKLQTKMAFDEREAAAV